MPDRRRPRRSRSSARRSAGLALVALAALGCGLVSSPRGAGAGVRAVAASLVASPTVGPPTSSVTVAAAGFGAAERVDVYFDSVATTAAGSFVASAGGGGTLKVVVRATARPKSHTWIARGRRTSRQARASFLVRASWPQVDYDATHSNFNPYENVLDVHTVSTLHRVWSVPPSYQCTPRLSAVANGLAYVGSCESPTMIFARDATTGVLRFSAPVSGQDWVSGPPTVANGRVYVVTEDVNTLSATDAVSGRPLWSVDLQTRPSSQSPIIAGGVVIASREAYDAVTGKFLWGVPYDDAPHGCAYGPAPSYDVSVAVSGTAVYFRCSDGSIETRDLKTGAIRSIRPSSTDGTPLVVVNGVMYYGSAGRLVARDATTGTLRWQTTVAAASQPAVAKGIAFASIAGGKVAAFDAVTGTLKWTTSVGAWASVPAVANGVVYVGAPSSLVALDAATGKLLRRAAGGGARATIVNGMVYAGVDAFAP